MNEVADSLCPQTGNNSPVTTQKILIVDLDRAAERSSSPNVSAPRPQTTARFVGIEVCILAGGLSTRMGRDKARLQLDGATMLARIRSVAEVFGAPVSAPARTGASATRRVGGRRSGRVRVIRQDAVPRCGPLGGIVTALRSSKARAVLFLACDMPLISPALLRRLARASRGAERAVFVAQSGRVGFPCLLPLKLLSRVAEQIAAQEFSLQALAKKLRAHRVILPARSRILFNVNTPEDAARAESLLCVRATCLRRPAGSG